MTRSKLCQLWINSLLAITLPGALILSLLSRNNSITLTDSTFYIFYFMCWFLFIPVWIIIKPLVSYYWHKRLIGHVIKVDYRFSILDSDYYSFELAVVLSLESGSFGGYTYYVALINEDKKQKVAVHRAERVKGVSTAELLTSVNPHVRKIGRERLAKEVREYKMLLVESGYYEKGR